ncbi:MAG TPA: GIY-YIG nuclease family protein [archaeon]|nr:GIY-YIG nuclease family protein [archaeon]
MRYIYLIQSLDDGFYKIGLSKHPNKRLNQLQTGNSLKLKLVEIYQSEFANLIEKTLQRKYSYLRMEGEWFNLTLDIELSFLDECKKIEENIKILKESGNYFI